MREFKVLNAPLFSKEVAIQLETHLAALAGIQQITTDPDNYQFAVIFDDEIIGFDTLGRTLALVGCPVQSIRALTFR